MNISATLAPDARVRPAATFDFDTRASFDPSGLLYVRASGLAQARLQLAILAGNRRRALREIDRLVEIDRHLARLAQPGETGAPDISAENMAEHLARQQCAIASEKLALLAGTEFPRGPGLPERAEPLLDDDEPVIVEDTAFSRKLALAGFWLVGLILLGTALAIAVPTLAAAF